MTIRVLIVDEHAVVRAGLCALLSLSSDLQVVGDVGGLAEALGVGRLLRPDVVLIEIGMGGGLDLARLHQLKGLESGLRVLILTASDDQDLPREALRAGADGYLLKCASGLELLSAIRAVSRGELYIHPSLTRGLLDRVADVFPACSPIADEALTPREIDVLRLVAQGYTNREAAEVLALSVRTVEHYRANLMDKLSMRSRAELVSYAVDHQLLQGGVALC